jgi:hypothetical protein
MSIPLDKQIAGLPRRDIWMAMILIAAMIAVDIAAGFTGPMPPWRALVTMPGTLALIWTCYAFSLRRGIRKNGHHRSIAKTSDFMGHSLSLVAGVLTAAHILLVGSFVWIHGLDKPTFIRAFMVALSVVLIVMHNRMPKFLASCVSADGPPVMIRGQRVTAWVGVLSGLAMIGVALTVPFGQATPVFLGLAMLPVAMVAGNSLIWWLERRRNPST